MEHTFSVAGVGRILAFRLPRENVKSVFNCCQNLEKKKMLKEKLEKLGDTSE